MAGTILGFDFGLERIGVAVGDVALGIAHPLTTIRRPDIPGRLDAIRLLVEEWCPVLLVLGLPRHMDGREHELGLAARRFGQRLEKRFGLPVAYVDERLTTVRARALLSETGAGGFSGKPHRDEVAAQVILQAYFDDDATT